MKRSTYTIILLVIVALVCGCTDSGVWERAEKKDTIRAYERYLEKYPNGEFVQNAKEKILLLKAKEGESAELYRAYLSQYPSGIYKKEAEVGLMGLEMTLWNRAENSNLLDDYNKYLAEFPQGNYILQAKLKVIELLDFNDWNLAQINNTVEAYQGYLSKHKQGKYKMEARTKIQELTDETDWTATVNRNTLEAYFQYMKGHPSGNHRIEAQQQITLLCTLNDNDIGLIESGIKNLTTGTTVGLILAGANIIDNDGDWTDVIKALRIYILLKNCDAAMIKKGLANAVLSQIDRTKVLLLAIKLGKDGTENDLNDLLMKFGDKYMAMDFANSGSDKLHQGAMNWAKEFDYVVRSVPSGGAIKVRATWGNFL